eukprot:TRINITY_DN2919_c0_g1_i3.p1 TRINITY_DN2919_c0_g1~~TRINITY_DN2919_c0_g1_i3.p1  ORF type:complete len:366 (-),score=134.90 TRINITY_DN2919_c0_g1_i3:210-1241(-)
MSRLLVFLQYGKNAVESALMGGVTHQTKENQLMVKDRETGLLVKENIPTYIKTALKTMSCSRVGRALTAQASSLMCRLSRRQGEKYDRPESVRDIPAFIQLHQLDLSEVEKPIDQYTSFNEFFARKLQPGARPIHASNDHTLAVIPADCRLMVFDSIFDAASIWVKGDKFSIENLLGPLAHDLAPSFVGGSFVIARLAPQDYHRWHIPVTGLIGEKTPIDGALYTVNPIAVNQNVNVYTENKRVIYPIDSDHFGKVLLIAVGATMVGSIQTAIEDNVRVLKGDMHGFFAFGGSTVLLLFEPGRIQFDPELLANSRQPIETLVKCNTYLGRASRPNQILLQNQA